MRRARGYRRAGRGGCRAGGQPQPGRPGSGPDLSVLHGTRAMRPATRTTRCCRSSTRRRRRRRSRSASSKARTAAKSSTSTCTCRRTTCGRRRVVPATGGRRGHHHARQVVHAAADSGTCSARRSSISRTRAVTTTARARRSTARSEGYVEIIEMATYFDDSDDGRQRDARRRRSARTARAHDRRTRPTRQRAGPRRPVRRHHADQRRLGFGLHGRRGRARQLLATIGAVHEAAGIDRPNLQRSVNPPASVVVAERHCVYSSTVAYRLNRADPGQRGADARPHHERVRARCRHEVGHRLGRDDADEAILRRHRHRHAGAACSSATSTGPTARATTSSLNIYDREENTTSTPLDFSPPPPTQRTRCAGKRT